MSTSNYRSIVSKQLNKTIHQYYRLSNSTYSTFTSLCLKLSATKKYRYSSILCLRNLIFHIFTKLHKLKAHSNFTVFFL